MPIERQQSADVATIHSETIFAEDKLKAEARYVIMQLEKTPTTNRLHWQGYLELKERKRLGQVKAIFASDTVHLELSLGSLEDNIKYCSKLETRADQSLDPFTYGTPESKRALNNREVTANYAATLKDVLFEIRERRMSIQEVSEEFPTVYVKHYNNIRRLIQEVNTTQDSRNCYVEVRVGSTGSGKTSSCFVNEKHTAELCKKYATPDEGELQAWSPDEMYMKRGMTQWFCGYNGQRVLILDDLIPYSAGDAKSLLSWLDRYGASVEVKGGVATMEWRHVVITTNIPVDNWFYKNGERNQEVDIETIKAIKSRIHRITVFDTCDYRRCAENRPVPYISRYKHTEEVTEEEGGEEMD